MELKGSVAVLTGGGGGIGEALPRVKSEIEVTGGTISGMIAK